MSNVKMPEPMAWTPIPGFERYSVSRCGKVKGSRGIMKQQITKKGYLRVCVRDLSGNKAYKTVHSLVLEAYSGPRPDGLVACHWNGIRTDNRIENLRWASHSDNYADKRRHGTDQSGERHGRRKLSLPQVREILAAKRSGGQYWGAKDFQEKYGVSKSTIRRIANGNLWRAPAISALIEQEVA